MIMIKGDSAGVYDPFNSGNGNDAQYDRYSIDVLVNIVVDGFHCSWHCSRCLCHRYHHFLQPVLLYFLL